jgi:NAD(P)-dependent dehydrogenase (short-subunit alcohol dehydrogenase family)
MPPSATGGALVTGGGRGLGARVAEVLADRGHLVHVTDVDLAAARATADRIGRGAFASALDVRDAAACGAAAAETAARAGRLAVWVNNAGVLFTGPAWTNTPEQRSLMLEVNVGGVMNGTVAAIEQMRGHGGGHVVNIASLAGLVAVPGETVYAGTKHAVMGFSLSTQADLRRAKVRDIRVSCICPDGIWTPMLEDKLDDPEAALSFTGRLLGPDEVAAAVGRVLDRPRQVTAVPRWRGAQVRLLDAMPGVAVRALPLVVLQGRRTQRRLRKKGLPERLR